MAGNLFVFLTSLCMVALNVADPGCASKDSLDVASLLQLHHEGISQREYDASRDRTSGNDGHEAKLDILRIASSPAMTVTATPSTLVASSGSASPWSTTCSYYPGKRVILLSANTQYIDLLKNWLSHASKYINPETEQVLVVAETKSVLPMLQNMSGMHGITFDIHRDASWFSSEDPNIASTFSNSVWASVVTHRPRMISRLLDAGCTVLYQDIDTAWVKSVFPVIDAFGQHDLIIADDSERRSKGKYLCTCFMYLQPTVGSKELMRMYIQAVEGWNDDQRPFNNELPKFKQQFQQNFKTDFDYFVLPQDLFPYRKVFPRYKETAVVAHANYLFGLEAKVAFFKEHRLWEP